jgi:hypothetical protein
MGPWNEESKLKIIMNKYWKECYHDEFSKFFENIGCQILNWKCLQKQLSITFLCNSKCSSTGEPQSTVGNFYLLSIGGNYYG